MTPSSRIVRNLTALAAALALLCTACGYRFYDQAAERARHEAASPGDPGLHLIQGAAADAILYVDGLSMGAAQQFDGRT
jgi:hypothetical protein